MQTQISIWKSAFVSPEQAVQIAENDEAKLHARIYSRYQETLRAYQAVDFDDLIHLPVVLFKQHPEALLRWQLKLRYLLVDEYQDTNDCQYQMIKLLAACAARSPWWAMTISRSTPGAARASRTCTACATITPACASSSWSRIIVPRNVSSRWRIT
jgi:superfamily I DNA/RNA helicase